MSYAFLCHQYYRGDPLKQESAKTLVDVDRGLRFAKCPRWIDQRLTFLDVHDRCIKSTDMEGAVRTEINLQYLPGGLGVLPAGELLVGDAWRRILHRLGKTRQEQVADLSRVARYCLSDAIVVSQGRIYLADVGYDFLNPLVDPVPQGIIMLVNDRGAVSPVAEDLFYPSGMVVTPDEKTLIVAETLGHRLTAFDIAEDGALGKRRLWARLPENVKPDGICLDGEGAIWVATTTPKALRILEGGQIVDEVVAKQAVFAVMLGGPQCKHLFLCTSASSDPIITRRTPSATIEIAAVNVSGVPDCADQATLLRSIM